MSQMKISGLGWIDSLEFGLIRSRERTFLGCMTDLNMLRKRYPIFDLPVKNIGRFDTLSILTCTVCALALRDAQIHYGPGIDHNMGVLATNRDGCIESNEVYFRDYIESGRQLARGNLFIYTLPTSAASEAAIHFGLHGPTVYLSGNDLLLLDALHYAGDMVSRGETESMMVVLSALPAAVALVVTMTTSEEEATSEIEGLCCFERALTIAEGGDDVPSLVNAFTDLHGRDLY